MLFYIIISILGILIVLLPFTDKITKWKKLILVIALLITAILNGVDKLESDNAKKNLAEDNKALRNKIDSLNQGVIFLNDSISGLKALINEQFTNTNSVLVQVTKKNDSINTKKYRNNRPVLILESAKIVKYKNDYSDYAINFKFINYGGKSVTNVTGRTYVRYNEQFSVESFSISKADIFPTNRGFIKHQEIPFNPDSVSLNHPSFFYFDITYSDLDLSNSYPYDVAVKLRTFEKGRYPTSLSMCSDEEKEMLKKNVAHLTK